MQGHDSVLDGKYPPALVCLVDVEHGTVSIELDRVGPVLYGRLGSVGDDIGRIVGLVAVPCGDGIVSPAAAAACAKHADCSEDKYYQK